MTRDDLAALDRKVDLLLELMCPKCGPAAIVRMHPELGPQAMRPTTNSDPVLLDAAKGNHTGHE